MDQKSVQEVRSFNRFYTDILGLLNQQILNSPYSLAEARIIYEIFHGKSVQASHIMTQMHIDKSYLSRILKKLERNKIIFKIRSDEDARAFLLSLTGKGIKEYEMLSRASDERIGKMLQPLTEEQRKRLVNHMKSVVEILKQ